jgi:CubicO group peptidase (beta-lactamase class C family)
MSKIYLLVTLIFLQLELHSQKLYFPPIVGNTWDTINPVNLGWCTQYVDELYSYLDDEQSKAFIVLKDGKIVLEKYFDTFTKDSLWYWASAGKTLTSFLVGMAQQDGKLKLNDLSSKYLGAGWTSEPTDKENQITIWNQLTMTTGLDDGVSDNHCTLKDCLTYKADAGTRWAYHNAPYTLLRDVLQSATGINENQYILNQLRIRTGMNGVWITSSFDNVYVSNPRSMARFGLLVMNHGVWNQDSLLKDQAYYDAMIHPSQSLNKSYGYLWWLNGQPSFMLPTLQIVFPGPLSPEAPKDMFAGIGKNGQLVCVVPSLNMVVVRMGESNGNGDEVSIVLCNQIWARLNKIMCVSAASNTNNPNSIHLYPNPTPNKLNISIPAGPEPSFMSIYDACGQLIETSPYRPELGLGHLEPGIYFIHLKINGLNYIRRFVKMD